MILDEFVAVSGYHRKAAVRVLSRLHDLAGRRSSRRRSRVYDEAERWLRLFEQLSLVR